MEKKNINEANDQSNKSEQQIKETQERDKYRF